MIKKTAFLTIIVCMVLVVSSCRHDAIPEFGITSPKSGWTYYDDTAIVFSSNLDSQKLVWRSSVDGELGKGPSLCMKLSAGRHVITLGYEGNSCSDSVEIVVNERNGGRRISLLQESGKRYVHDDRSFNAGIFSIDGSINGQTVDFVSDEPAATSCAMLDPVVRIPAANALRLKVSSFRAVGTETDVPPERTFYVINTIDQTEAHEITACLASETESLYVYVDSDVGEGLKEKILECVESFEKTAYSRVVDIWGSCLDLNGDGKFTLLFTPVINDEGVAVGFFNQQDFFERDEDTGSESYNPYSNEMDVCYVAVPDETNSNYSFGSIIATVAHEITHAVNFSKKTYSKLLEGQEEAGIMETFLDEGLSHITESLVGYGETGGNLKFVERYLTHTNRYSFCSTDIYGRSDSVSQRGAMTLFLYYLFAKKGGMEWDADGSVVDNGGVEFLRNIISSQSCDWNAIGEAMDTDTDRLFKDFCIDLFERKMDEIFDFSITDPLTDEKIFYCPEITPIDVADADTVLPYSLMKFSTDTGTFNLEWKTLTGNIYVVY